MDVDSSDGRNTKVNERSREGNKERAQRIKDGTMGTQVLRKHVIVQEVGDDKATHCHRGNGKG